MAQIKDLLIYLLDAYENKHELSKTRLTKLIYLCDWKFSIEYGVQMTNIDWFFDNYGPFVWDVIKVVEDNYHIFNIKETTNSFGNDKIIISLNPNEYESAQLSPKEMKVLGFVIDSTKNMRWNDFIKLVYSTYPVISSNRHEKLNLVELAEEYKSTPFYKNVSPDIEYIKIEDDEDEF